jgi:polar amino acid transport system substrate-binding protein
VTAARRSFVAAMLSLIALVAARTTWPTATDAARHTLAPTGALRVGLYVGSPSSIIPPTRPDDATRGVGYDLGREMAKRLGVPFEPVVFDNNGLVLAAVKRGDVDVTFTNATSARARDMDFSPAFLDVEKSFIVPPASPARTLADMRRAGLRVGVSTGSTTAVELAAEYPTATIVPVPTLKAAIDLLADGRLDAFATNKAILFEMSDSLPGSRVLGGRWGLEHFAAAIPKGRDRQSAFVAAFIDAARKDGLVDRAVVRAGLRGTVEP